MNGQSNRRKIQRITILIDIAIVVISLFTAWFIRSQFQLFMYDIRKFSILFPWVLISRIFFNLFFGLYSYTYTQFTQLDIIRLFKYNLVTSVVVLVLRLFSTLQILSMPLSMIFMEYVFSCFGFLMLRLYIHHRMVKTGNHTIGYKRRVLLWGELLDIKRIIGDIHKFQLDNGVKVLGILNANPFFWGTEAEKIRIFGDASQLPRLLAGNDSISTICLVNPTVIKKRTALSLQNAAKSYNLELYSCRDQSKTMKKIDPRDIVSVTDNR